MAPSDAVDSIDVAAPPEDVWALITDLDVLAELADETAAMRWTKGNGVAVGAVFRGTNRRGRHRWTTTCRVTEAEAGRHFGFEVTYAGLKVARWDYRLTATADGCTVTESTTDRRAAWFASLSRVATGTDDRGAANAAHIRTTLDRLKARVEQA